MKLERNLLEDSFDLSVIIRRIKRLKHFQDIVLEKLKIQTQLYS